jgi:hypothetical protein
VVVVSVNGSAGSSSTDDRIGHGVLFASNADRRYIIGEVLTLPGGEERAASLSGM